VVDDSLGIGEELESLMAAHVAHYADEWAATLADPDRLARFVSFVNAPGTPDPVVGFVPERDQVKPDLPLLSIGLRPARDVLEGSAPR
jgi:nitrite reductase (NADH) large subunit